MFNRMINFYDGNKVWSLDAEFGLGIFCDVDPVNLIRQKTVFANVTYLVNSKTGEILFIRQTKDNRIVDELVGIGGKMPYFIDDVLQTEEKIWSDLAYSALLEGKLSLGNIREHAAREVYEETATYCKKENGYSDEIIEPGLVIDERRLNNIGLSKVRLIFSGKAEAWIIYNFAYLLNDKELEFLQDIAYQNREGKLHWMNLNDALPQMSFADYVILKNQNKELIVEEIRDKVNQHSIVRSSISLNDDMVALVNFDRNKIQDYVGSVITPTGNEREFYYPEFKELSGIGSRKRTLF